MKSTQLSNVQKELLKLYSTDLSEQDLLELKRTLAKFYAERATKGADKVWKEQNLSAENMDSWLNEG